MHFYIFTAFHHKPIEIINVLVSIIFSFIFWRVMSPSLQICNSAPI